MNNTPMTIDMRISIYTSSPIVKMIVIVTPTTVEIDPKVEQRGRRKLRFPEDGQVINAESMRQERHIEDKGTDPRQHSDQQTGAVTSR